jgi:hypothetical protein
MEEISEWFLNEFGHLGFDLTHIMYDPDTFTPSKAVIFKPYNGPMILTRIRITPIFEDIIGKDIETEYKYIVTQEIHGFLEERGLKDFKPKQKINKFKL